MRDLDHQLVNGICKTHITAWLDVVRSFMAMHIPIELVRHEFIPPYDEEYVTYDGMGWHIVKDWDGDGKIQVRAEPGEFVQSTAGKMWVKRITRFHSVMGNAVQ